MPAARHPLKKKPQNQKPTTNKPKPPARNKSAVLPPSPWWSSTPLPLGRGAGSGRPSWEHRGRRDVVTWLRSALSKVLSPRPACASQNDGIQDPMKGAVSGSAWCYENFSRYTAILGVEPCTAPIPDSRPSAGMRAAAELWASGNSRQHQRGGGEETIRMQRDIRESGKKLAGGRQIREFDAKLRSFVVWETCN